MKPLKVTRKITIAVRELLDALLSERWFELRIEDRDFNPYDENVNIITTFNIRDLEDELINCSESESELQDTLNKMYSIWMTYYNKERNFLAFADTDELFSTWKDKYNGEIAQDAIVIIIRLRNVISGINVILFGLAQAHGLKLTEEQPTPEITKFIEKYGNYIHDIDKFLIGLKTMKGRELAQIYNKLLKKSPIDLKEFVEDVLLITPERKGEKGWNYEAIRKH